MGCLLCLHVCTELACRCLPAIRLLVPAPRGRPIVRPQPHHLTPTRCRLPHRLPTSQAAVVVVASQRKSGISEFLLGSVAAHCAQHSPRPVLVLHAPQPGGSEGAGPALLGRLASAAAAALGGHPEEAEQQRAAAAATAEQRQQQQQQMQQQPACSVGRHIILAVDDSGGGGRGDQFVQCPCKGADT